MQKSINFWLRSALGALILTAATGLVGSVQGADAQGPDSITSAVAAYRQGNFNLAIAEFTLLVQSGDREAYYGRAKAYFQKGDYDRAIADLDNVIQIQKDPSLAALELRGEAFFKKAAYESAILDFDRVIQSRPRDPDLFIRRADAYFYSGHPSRAFADYNQAIQFNPTNALAFAHRGELYASYKHNYRRGIVDCLTAISLDPDCWLAYNNLAALLAVCPSAKLRDGQLALLDARKACELTHWNNPLPISVLAAAYAETHDFADAINWQQQSISMDLDTSPEGARLALTEEKKLELYENHRPFHASSH